MKWSRYNFIEDNGDGRSVLYNCRTNAGIILESALADLLKEKIDCIDELADIHPSFFQNLADRDFLVLDGEDEYESVVEEILREEESPTSFEVIVNPTMDCNLRCWYCYEKHLAGTIMSQEMLDSVAKFIRSKIENEGTEHFTLSFFGGEPLLGFEECVRPLVSLLKEEISKGKGKTTNVGFTTNAVLLTHDVVDFLADSGFEVSCQVPFDGGQLKHDKVKVDADGNGTFNTVVANIAYGLECGLAFIIRCNYTSDNVKSFSELVDIMEPLAKKHPRKVRFSLQRIWQEKEAEQLNDSVDDLERMIREKGLSSIDGRKALGEHCYADSANSVVINYDGNVFKCTARVFSPSIREGWLGMDGIITYNDRYKRRLETRFSNAACRDCRIFPLCELCTQRRLEQRKEGCYYSYGASDKEAVVRSAIINIFG